MYQVVAARFPSYSPRNGTLHEQKDKLSKVLLVDVHPPCTRRFSQLLAKQAAYVAVKQAKHQSYTNRLCSFLPVDAAVVGTGLVLKQ